ncbi:hypothetical protein LEMLEM_LOCUS322, partial [Lemmus lemmus]
MRIPGRIAFPQDGAQSSMIVHHDYNGHNCAPHPVPRLAPGVQDPFNMGLFLETGASKREGHVKTCQGGAICKCRREASEESGPEACYSELGFLTSRTREISLPVIAKIVKPTLSSDMVTQRGSVSSPLEAHDFFVCWFI